jgi:hypothetical protein
MKTENNLNGDILKITAIIQLEFPELIPFLNEMPETIPDSKKPIISATILQDYYNSLQNLLLKYAPNHTYLQLKKANTLKMETIKKIAVYMDHFSANLIEYIQKAKELKVIESDFNHFEKEKIMQKGESHLHNKEQDLQNKFYLEIKTALLDYSEIVLFGPTTAKTELHTILSNDKHFLEVKISIKITDKLTQNEQIAFVNNCFYIDNK